MIPSRFKCYHDIDNRQLKRIRVFIGGYYLFTFGTYKNEMGFYIDFPKFSSYKINSDICTIPKGVVKDFDVSLGGQRGNICPKISFHESGQVHFSKAGVIFGKSLVKNKINDSIYDNNGSHVLTIMMQNISKLEHYDQVEKSKERNLNLPFENIPLAIKFVGNIWKEEDLVKDFGELYSLKHSDLPLYWKRADSNLGDLTLIIKFSHKATPLYLSLRCMPIKVLDQCEKNPFLSVMTGWKFEEMKDGENDATLIGFMARK